MTATPEGRMRYFSCSVIAILLTTAVHWNFAGADGGDIDIAVVIMSQPNLYHERKAQRLRQNLQHQAALYNTSLSLVLLTHEQWPDTTGAWTVFPIVPILADIFNGTNTIILFCDDDLTINLSRLSRKLKNIDLNKELFLGRALTDREATIIHHFAFHEDPSGFSYPDFAAGFMISTSLLRRLAKRLKENSLSVDFTIDFQHELALFIWDKGSGVLLTDVDYLCGFTTKADMCATRRLHKSPDCSLLTSDSDIFFAVKTCQKFHKVRIPVLKASWGKDAKEIEYFSDAEDGSIPTVVLGIPNTERGHCAKFMAILNYVYERLNAKNYKWIVITDDDTLMSISRLKKLLSCYDPNTVVVLGERYGYGVAKGYGYDYITLGGGMALSAAALRMLIDSRSCHCAADDSPDDMTFGLCLKHLKIPVTHSPLFHQARPVDYADGYLSNQESVSFHRHWMIDPIMAYRQWLVDEQTTEEADDQKSIRSQKDHSINDHLDHKEL